MTWTQRAAGWGKGHKNTSNRGLACRQADRKHGTQYRIPRLRIRRGSHHDRKADPDLKKRRSQPWHPKQSTQNSTYRSFRPKVSASTFLSSERLRLAILSQRSTAASMRRYGCDRFGENIGKLDRQRTDLRMDGLHGRNDPEPIYLSTIQRNPGNARTELQIYIMPLPSMTKPCAVRTSYSSLLRQTTHPYNIDNRRNYTDRSPLLKTTIQEKSIRPAPYEKFPISPDIQSD